jgi:hypothetical protein
MAISRYIHLNPVKIKSAEDLELKRKTRLLEEFKYSRLESYGQKGTEGSFEA